VEVSPLGLEALDQHRGGVAVAAVLEHPRDQLVDRLLGGRVDALLLGGGEHQPRLHLQERRDQDQELGRYLQVELPLALEVGDIGGDHLAQLDLEQADLLAEDDGQQQVEGAGEDLEVEIQLAYGHARITRQR
jgi:hypothetical protein